MRLSQLEATFVGQFKPGSFHEHEPIETAQGVLFFCPKCQSHSILVWFKSPRNAPMVPVDAFPKNDYRWEFSGTCIDDLTLSPSVDLSRGQHDPTDCLWHGLVKNGDAT